MIGSEHLLSTHLIRATARASEQHYQRVQSLAMNSDPAALRTCSALHIALNDVITVRRARHERGKWCCVARPRKHAE